MRRAWRVLARIWPWMFLWELSLLAWGLLASYLTLGRRGHLDWTWHAIGRDFINYWTAGHLVRSGQVADIFQPAPFLAHERALFDPRLPFHFWSYPPPNLFLVAPLGFTPYMAGLAVWSAAGLVALGFATRAWTRNWWVWALIVFCPAAPTNIGLGQNGAFSAALLIAGLSLIDRRPALAGALLGLLIFKPQIAVMLPIAVLAGRRWRAMGGAAAVVVAVLALSVLVFGIESWRGFFGPTLQTQGLMLRQGHGPFQWMMPSAYMSARLAFHMHMPQALMVQAPFTLLAVALTAWSWRRADRPLELRAAVLMMATFVASPQAFNYDLIPAAAAAVVLLRRDPLRWLALPLAMLVWVTPLVMLAWAVPDAMTHFEWARQPAAPLVLTAALVRLVTLPDAERGDWIAGRRARRAGRRARRSGPAPAPA
jgi:hypothetical protein